MPTLIYTDCAECGTEAPILTVDRDVPPDAILQPEENDDLKRALYGTTTPDENTPIVAKCPNGHVLRRGQVIMSAVHE